MDDHQLFIVAIISAIGAILPGIIMARARSRQMASIERRLDKNSEKIDEIAIHTNGMRCLLITNKQASDAGILKGERNILDKMRHNTDVDDENAVELERVIREEIDEKFK